MGDLLSRAPEEIAFFSRTRETSQDNLKSRVMSWPLLRIMEGGALRRQARPLYEQKARGARPSTRACALPRWIGFSENPVRLGPLAKQSPKAQIIRRRSRDAFCQRVEDNAFHPAHRIELPQGPLSPSRTRMRRWAFPWYRIRPGRGSRAHRRSWGGRRCSCRCR